MANRVPNSFIVYTQSCSDVFFFFGLNRYCYEAQLQGVQYLQSNTFNIYKYILSSHFNVGYKLQRDVRCSSRILCRRNVRFLLI